MAAAAGEPAHGPTVTRPTPRWLRWLEAVVGVLSAGVLVLGVGLVVAQVVAPRMGGTGLDATNGPGWDRALATVATGVIGEVLRGVRRRLPNGVRLIAVVAMSVAIAALLWFTWWR